MRLRDFLKLSVFQIKEEIQTIWHTPLFAIILILICAGDAICANESAFNISRGVNISHWLSQSQRRGQQRQDYFTKKDVAYIAGLGYDHIRLPIDEEQMWDENGNKENEAFALLNNAIKWSESRHLKVVVDLHILRSHHFNAKDKPLWTDPKAQEHFLLLWRDLSSELKKYSVGLVAYELMNEPVADDHEDWNKLVEKAVKEIRKQEPDRKIVIGSNKWQSVGTFDQLRIPEGDRNIILSFHFYTPMLITHYKASWTGVGKYKGPVNYPGQIVAADDIEGLPADIAGIVKKNNGVYNRKILEKLLEKPLAVAKNYNLPLYCGEWGCLSTTPRKARLQWYKDVRQNLEKHNIAWANWDYKGGFGIVGREGQPNEEMIRTLIPK
jgi:endoglucanase